MQMNTIELNIDKYESMLKELGVLKTENERLREALHRACDNCTEDCYSECRALNCMHVDVCEGDK